MVILNTPCCIIQHLHKEGWNRCQVAKDSKQKAYNKPKGGIYGVCAVTEELFITACSFYLKSNSSKFRTSLLRAVKFD